MTAPPQRLSLRTLLVHPVRQLSSLFVPLVALLFVGNAFGQQQFIVLPVVIAGVAVFSLVRWATFTYRLAGDQIEIVQGVVNRQRRAIPLDRVRGVDVTASFLHRILGLAVVRIDAAAGGETQQEGELDAVTAAEAERLRTVLLRRSPYAGQQVSADEAGDEGAGVLAGQADTEAEQDAGKHPGRDADQHPGQGAGQDVTIARLQPRWYLYAPLTGYVFVPLALLGALIGFVVEIFGRTGAVSEENVRRAFEIGATMPYALAAVVFAVAIIAVPIVAVAAFAFTNWKFTLRLRDGSLVGERGLFNRRSVSLERTRVRGWLLRESLLQRIPRTAGVHAVVTGLGDVQNRAELLPIAPRAEAVAAAGRAAGPFSTALMRHPGAARTRRLIRAVVPWLAAAGAALLAGLPWLALGFLVLAALGVPLGLDRYHSLGHAVEGERLSVRSGSLLRQQVVIERRAVVGWTVRQTWLQRRVGLVTLVAGVGAGGGGYPAVDVDQQEAARFAAEVTPGWVTPSLEEVTPTGEDYAANTE